MSSGCGESSRHVARGVVLQGLEDDSGESSLEATQCLGLGVSGGQPLVVVGAAEATETYLGDGDAVECRVELAVAGLVVADPASGASGPDRDRGDTGVHGVLGVAGEPVDPGGLPEDLGRGQRCAAG